DVQAPAGRVLDGEFDLVLPVAPDAQVDDVGIAGLQDVDRVGPGGGTGDGFGGLGPGDGPEERAGQEARGRPGPDQAKVAPQHCVGPFWTSAAAGKTAHGEPATGEVGPRRRRPEHSGYSIPTHSICRQPRPPPSAESAKRRGPGPSASARLLRSSKALPT